MIKHRGYVGVFEFDEKTSLFLGKVSNAHHLVTFQGKSIESTKQAFKDAVDEYIDWSKKYSNVPDKPLAIG
jgi:predicted HicB family RNase H-like nuclease